MQAAQWIVQPLGDRAFLLAWGGADISARQVAAVARRIRRAAPAWLQELVPAYRSIAVHIHMRFAGLSPLQASEELLRALEVFDIAPKAADTRLVELLVRYGGEDGPDLEASASRSGLTVPQFIEKHSEAEYEVAMIGFAPGFPYLSGLPAELSQPRHETPRLSVPAGAVGIAGGQTGVYPVASPGGWQIIGRTTAKLFRPEDGEPFLLASGDRVKFVPIEGSETESVASTRLPDVEPTASERAVARGPAALAVVKPGMLTTVQDLGRPGWQAYGVSVGGAMDAIAMRAANILVGNKEEEAGLEMTLLGPTLDVAQDLLVAISGADVEAFANGEPLPMNKPILLRSGTKLSFGRVTGGCRAYMAVAGGIDVPLEMGSRSADLRARIGGGGGLPLSTGDSLCAGQPTALSLVLADTLLRRVRSDGRRWGTVPWAASLLGPKRAPERLSECRLRVLVGAEWETFGDQARRTLLDSAYRVEASSDRMGIRLSGPVLSRLSDTELRSHGVVPGTIQVPQSGQPIVLAPGCQPTGGYPKLAHVITADLPLLAQLAPGSIVRFELAKLEDAGRAREEQGRDIALLQAGVFAKVCELENRGVRA
ncbi:5-oxoprolinase subunit PxpB [Cohnella panacarvi]|uniref:5-oxoprolinase subunit PxpB n=1 Tax=Cohnella panacarvi TaxID=400776 RepID=UPI0004797759|nr:5-oxoprolinase subunit PxpB [Cohnella panacarvi]